MKKIIITFIFILTSIVSYSQNDSIYYDDIVFDNIAKQETVVMNENYFEFGLGSLIPTDESNSYFNIDLELGKYLNKYIGVGLNFKFGSESEYHDRLGYVGPKIKFRINPNPRNLLDLDLFAGLGYGWYDYNLDGYDYYGYYDNYKTMNYVVPNIGLTGYINFNKYVSLGIEPGYYWYISTNKDESDNVGVWNIVGKLRFRF